MSKKLLNLFLLAFIFVLVLYAKKIIGIIEVLTGKSKKENTLDINNINQNLVKSENAIQGELSLIGEQMQKEIDEGKRQDFDKIVFSNIGNPQAVGQKPITFYRQVLSLLEHPDLLDETNIESLYPKDVIERAKEYLKKSQYGVGAYTNAQGFELF
jgi:predicted PurR-regulated permease PerM